MWNASSPHTYGLGYHWLYPSNKVEQFTNPITWLSADVPPGTRRIVRARVTAPATPGRYLLIWDMIWKGTTWFAPKTGNYQMRPVTVIEPRGRICIPTRSSTCSPPDIASLPTAPALDRRQIWPVAIKMIEQHPLFGEGSQGVRMNYPAFCSFARGQASKSPPHAHDLAFEILADWGASAADYLPRCWSCSGGRLSAVCHGDVTSAWQLAVIGMVAALLGHDLVDYFSPNRPLSPAVLWLLCGLAAVMAPASREGHS